MQMMTVESLRSVGMTLAITKRLDEGIVDQELPKFLAHVDSVGQPRTAEAFRLWLHRVAWHWCIICGRTVKGKRRTCKIHGKRFPVTA